MVCGEVMKDEEEKSKQAPCSAADFSTQLSLLQARQNQYRMTLTAVCTRIFI